MTVSSAWNVLVSRVCYVNTRDLCSDADLPTGKLCAMHVRTVGHQYSSKVVCQIIRQNIK